MLDFTQILYRGNYNVLVLFPLAANAYNLNSLLG